MSTNNVAPLTPRDNYPSTRPGSRRHTALCQVVCDVECAMAGASMALNKGASDLDIYDTVQLLHNVSVYAAEVLAAMGYADRDTCEAPAPCSPPIETTAEFTDTVTRQLAVALAGLHTIDDCETIGDAHRVALGAIENVRRKGRGELTDHELFERELRRKGEG